MSTVTFDSTPPPSSRGSTPSPRKGRWTLMNNPIMNLVDQVILKLGSGEAPKPASKIEEDRVTTAPAPSVQSLPPTSQPISIPSSSKQTAINMSHDFDGHMEGFDPNKNNPSKGKFFETAFELVNELTLLESDINIKLIDPILINKLNTEYGKQIGKETDLRRAKDLKKEIASFCRLPKASEEARRQLLDEAVHLHSKITEYGQDSELEIPILMLEQYGQEMDLAKAKELVATILNYCNSYFLQPVNKVYEEKLRWDATVLHKKLVSNYSNNILEHPLEILRQTTEQNNQ